MRRAVYSATDRQYDCGVSCAKPKQMHGSSDNCSAAVGTATSPRRLIVAAAPNHLVHFLAQPPPVGTEPALKRVARSRCLTGG